MNTKNLFVTFLLTMCMVLAVTGCGSREQEASAVPDGKDTAETQEQAAQNAAPIRIATKPMTEQYVLGEMLGLLIEEYTEYTVEITKGIGGGTSNIHPAMKEGEFDLYPEYTSSGWVLVLGHGAGEVDDETMMKRLREEYAEKFDMTWLGLYGFNNTYAVVVRGDLAREHGLVTCSDLMALSGELVFGGNGDYIERADGFQAVCDTYGYDFKEVVDIDIGLKYAALDAASIDVTNGCTTDAQLGIADVVALQDDKNLQVNYFCSTVVRQETLRTHPGLEKALEKMTGILTDQEMAGLSAQVENGAEERDVARVYLTEKGLLAG